MPVWVGEEEMSSALSSLCRQRPVAASKVKVAAKIALKYSNDYKMAVHSIEGFIRKAAPEDKLCGIYVLDAICRQPKSQMFRERFAIRYVSSIYCVWHYLMLREFVNGSYRACNRRIPVRTPYMVPHQ